MQTNHTFPGLIYNHSQLSLPMRLNVIALLVIFPVLLLAACTYMLCAF